LTNIKNKTPGTAGRFVFSILCDCEADIIGSD